MTEHKTLPREIMVELRNLLISIVRKDARNDTDTLPGGNISWLNADRTLEDYPATFIVPPPKFIYFGLKFKFFTHFSSFVFKIFSRL